jgi:hypothetical protein
MCQIPDPHLPCGKWEMGFWDLGVGVDLNRGVRCGCGWWLVGARKGNKQTYFGSKQTRTREINNRNKQTRTREINNRNKQTRTREINNRNKQTRTKEINNRNQVFV